MDNPSLNCIIRFLVPLHYKSLRMKKDKTTSSKIWPKFLFEQLPNKKYVHCPRQSILLCRFFNMWTVSDTVHIFCWKDAQTKTLVTMGEDVFSSDSFHNAMANDNGWYSSRTDYPMDIFVLKEKVVVDQIFELQVYKNSKHLCSNNTIFKWEYSTMMNTKHFCSKHLSYQEHQVLSSGSNSMIANILKTRWWYH